MAKARAFIQHESDAFYEEIDNLATFLLEFRYGLPSHVHILHDGGYVVGLSKFLLHEVGIVPREQFIVDGTPENFQPIIREDLASISDKREIPLYFEPDAGKAQNIIRDLPTGAGGSSSGPAGTGPAKRKELRLPLRCRSFQLPLGDDHQLCGVHRRPAGD